MWVVRYTFLLLTENNFITHVWTVKSTNYFLFTSSDYCWQNKKKVLLLNDFCEVNKRSCSNIMLHRDIWTHTPKDKAKTKRTLVSTFYISWNVIKLTGDLKMSANKDRYVYNCKQSESFLTKKALSCFALWSLSAQGLSWIGFTDRSVKLHEKITLTGALSCLSFILNVNFEHHR